MYRKTSFLIIFLIGYFLQGFSSYCNWKKKILLIIMGSNMVNKSKGVFCKCKDF